MKSSFKLILSLTLLSSQVMGREIFLISYDKKLPTAQMMEKILVEKFNIPKTFIKLEWSASPCKRIGHPVVQVCLTNRGKVLFPVYRHKVMTKSFRAFTQGVNNNEI